MSIQNDLSMEQLKEMNDSESKLLLRNSQLVARFVKNFVIEAKDLSLDEIERCICKTQVSTGNIKDITIDGDNTYVYADNKSYIIVDVLITLDFGKNDKKDVRVFLNLEAQNDNDPGYALVSRGIVYGALLIGKQLKVEFDSRTYDNVKKVYSIWIMPQSPKYMDGLIREYSFNETILRGDENLKNDVKNYDKIDVLQIYTSQMEDKDDLISNSKYDDILNILRILFSKKISSETKMEKLTEYGFRGDPDLERRVENMCNLSDGIEQMTREEDKKAFAESLIESINDKVLTIAQAAKILKVSEEEFKAYMA